MSAQSFPFDGNSNNIFGLSLKLKLLNLISNVFLIIEYSYYQKLHLFEQTIIDAPF